MDKYIEEKSRGSALQKALRVLDVITRHPQSVGLPDISAEVGMPRQTVHRVLGQLEEAGLVKRDPARERFAVGTGLTELALSSLYSSNQSAPVGNILRRLVDEIHETCNIGILRGMDYVYLDRIECEWSLRIHLQIGSGVPAHCSAGGKVVLAYLPRDLRAKLLRSVDLRAETANTLTDPGAIERSCAEIREAGYGINLEEMAPGISGVAVPISDRYGRVPAAIAVQGPSIRISEERAVSLVPRLTAAAKEIATLWGLVDGGADVAA